MAGKTKLPHELRHKKTAPRETVLKKAMEAMPRFELGVKALQASALPLGHIAILTKGPINGPVLSMERTTGLEPATPTLARLCSTN